MSARYQRLHLHNVVSVAIEKGSRPADVLSVVTDKSATTSTISITENAEKSNPSDKKSAKNISKGRFALPKSTLTNDIAYGSIERIKKPTLKEQAEAIVSG